MCGRYTLSTPGEEIAEVFGVEEGGVEEGVALAPRFNIAPSQEAPVIRIEGAGRRRLAGCRWGFVPHWAEAPDGGPRSINARSETVGGKPAFRDSFRRRRCLVVGDGFYEWKGMNGRKQPFYFSLPSAEPFAMAGLWDRWGEADDALETFAILTARANAEVGAVHDRMPMILPETAWEPWLDCAEGSIGAAQAILESPPPDGLLACRPVSTRVNSPANDDPSLIVRQAPEDEEPAPPRLF